MSDINNPPIAEDSKLYWNYKYILVQKAFIFNSSFSLFLVLFIVFKWKDHSKDTKVLFMYAYRLYWGHSYLRFISITIRIDRIKLNWIVYTPSNEIILNKLLKCVKSNFIVFCICINCVQDESSPTHIKRNENICTNSLHSCHDVDRWRIFKW